MPAFSQLREWSHAAVAVLGILAASTALIVTVLALFGVHVTEADVAQKLGGVGALVTLLSKAVDSWNNAQTATALATPSASTPATSAGTWSGSWTPAPSPPIGGTTQ
jgi:hypothetical protein